jgi:ABC-2 type transport system permease protein
MNWLLPAITLWQREIVRFLRQRDRLVGAFATPIMFWLLLGLGLGKSFTASKAPGGHGYLEYFYAGTLVMILLFTAIFSTFTLIEDRREGFLQAVLVAPVGRFALVGGKVLGGTTLALLQALIFLAFAPFVGFKLTVGAVLWLTATMFLSAFALTALGFAIAWWMNSTAGYHAVMNVFLIPLWLLSGSVFPASGAPKWLGWVMAVNPLSYSVEALQAGLYGESGAVAFAVTALFAVVMFVAALSVTRQVTKGDLQ